MFAAKMTEHLYFVSEWLVLDGQLCEGIEHNGLSLRAAVGIGEVLVDSLKDLLWVLAHLDEEFRELRNDVAANTDEGVGDMGQTEGREKLDGCIVLQFEIGLSKALI